MTSGVQDLSPIPSSVNNHKTQVQYEETQVRYEEELHKIWPDQLIQITYEVCSPENLIDIQASVY